MDSGDSVREEVFALFCRILYPVAVNGLGVVLDCLEISYDLVWYCCSTNPREPHDLMEIRYRHDSWKNGDGYAPIAHTTLELVKAGVLKEQLRYD